MTLRSLLRASLLALVLAAPAARAGGFSTTNVQVLQGYNFKDPLYYTGGTMTTVTLNHFSTWDYGDNFLFVDAYSGHFKDGFNPAHPVDPAAGNGQNLFKLYSEWHPRLFVNQLLGQKDPVLGIIRNWGVAGEVNYSQGFGAYLAGGGLDLQIPGFAVAGLNVYYRWDSTLASAHQNQWQVSPFWTVPFNLGKVPFLFTGFVDVNGTWDYTKNQSFVEVWAQPELLVDAMAPFGGTPNKLYVGCEWFYHRHFLETTSAPQAMVQWNMF